MNLTTQPSAEPKTMMPLKRILVVEDDSFWRVMIRNYLLRQDYAVAVDYATSVSHAVFRIHHQQNYDLIISDFRLQGNNTGIDLWSECQKIGCDIPFILTSGYQHSSLEPLLKDGLIFVEKSRLSDEIPRFLDFPVPQKKILKGGPTADVNDIKHKSRLRKEIAVVSAALVALAIISLGFQDRLADQPVDTLLLTNSLQEGAP